MKARAIGRQLGVAVKNWLRLGASDIIVVASAVDRRHFVLIQDGREIGAFSYRDFVTAMKVSFQHQHGAKDLVIIDQSVTDNGA